MKSTPRTRRLGESVREALSEVLRDDVADPRVDFVTITSVEVSSDLNLANVYVTTHGGEAEYEALLEGLRSADKRIRAGLARRVQMRVVPELRYHLDTSLDQSMRITEALKDVPPTLLVDEDNE
ncbi:MAG: 30S ribosome-binding factor RbfA [Coriobacteriia bacterium]|nr:30S ribosome-binding factor RbfA [Coriobacteriia bacterium]MBN2840043.1 30S ribosome-binding factor RbfA [Coriobacteriia bacterium]